MLVIFVMNQNSVMEKICHVQKTNSSQRRPFAVLPVVLAMKMNSVMENVLNVQKMKSSQKEQNAELLLVLVMKLNSVMEKILNAQEMNLSQKEQNAVTAKNVPKLNSAVETKPSAHTFALNQKELFADLPKVHVIKPKNAMARMTTAPKMNSREKELSVAKLMVPVNLMQSVMEKMMIAQRMP
jgi:hypothetical protein